MWNDLYLNVTVNKKAMRLFGCETATYFAELSQVVKRVIEKETAVDGYFPLDRKYIERELGLSLEQQYNCDSILVRNGVLSCRSDSRDWIAVDNDRWTALIASEDTKVLAEVLKQSNLPKSVMEADARNARAAIRAEEKKAKDEAAELERIQKEEKREAKNRGVRITMKSIASKQPLANSEDLVNALGNWVDSIYDAKNFLTKASIEIFCNKIAGFSQDSNVRKELVEIAAARSYKDATFVLEVYNRSHVTTAVKVVQPQKITNVNNVDTSVSF